MREDNLVLLPEKYLNATITEDKTSYIYEVNLLEVGKKPYRVAFGYYQKDRPDSLRKFAINTIYRTIQQNKEYNAFNFDCPNKDYKFMFMKVFNENGMNDLDALSESAYKYINQTLSKIPNPIITFESCTTI